VNVLTTGSAASLQVIRLLQESPEFTERIRELRDGWRTDAFVHRDLRWENCLVSRDPANGRWTRLTIVDWELAGRGDAAWDLGTLLASYLRLWLWSIPFVPEVPLGESMELARFPLERLQPAVRALWGAYHSERGDAAGTPSELVIRATRYAAVVLLQSALEDAQMSMRAQPHLAHIVQLSYNILERPAEAAVYLGGLDLAEGRP
jgi:aminoglycoside phosphotransferase (APT) family kinase protein